MYRVIPEERSSPWKVPVLNLLDNCAQLISAGCFAPGAAGCGNICKNLFHSRFSNSDYLSELIFLAAFAEIFLRWVAVSTCGR